MSSRSSPPIRNDTLLLSAGAVILAWGAFGAAWYRLWVAIPLGLLGTAAAWLAYRRGMAAAAARQAELRRVAHAEAARSEEHRLLRELAGVVLSFRSSDQLFGEVARVGRALLRADAGAVLLRAGEDRFLRLAGAAGFDQGGGRLLPVEGSVAGAALSAGTPVAIDRLESPEVGPGFATSAAAPLRAQGVPIGVVAVYRRSADGRFTPQDLDVLETLAEQVALGLDRAALLEEARQNERVLERTNRELIEATELKSQFLANMSHELRTPLNAIIGFADLLASDGDPDPTRIDYLISISRNGRNLLAMIDEVLDAAKVEAGRMTLRRSRFDLRDVARVAIQDTDSLRATKSQDCRQDLGLEPLSIDGDQQKLRQVLFNLLSNASKFTDTGGTIAISARRAELPLPVRTAAGVAEGVAVREAAWVQVHDTGIGIAEEDQAKLFQPFSQVDSSASRSQSGTGLGLALCRQFVELHGGTIGVESTVGQGSSFWFALPLED